MAAARFGGNRWEDRPDAARGSEAVSGRALTRARARRLAAAPPAGIAASFNLGHADFYPSGSGKEGAARHLCAKWGVRPGEAAALCDDDNDLAMCALVGAAFLPGVSADRY